MCPRNELTGLVFYQAMLAFRHLNASHQEAELFRLEREALKVRQSNRPLALMGLGFSYDAVMNKRLFLLTPLAYVATCSPCTRCGQGEQGIQRAQDLSLLILQSVNVKILFLWRVKTPLGYAPNAKLVFKPFVGMNQKQRHQKGKQKCIPTPRKSSMWIGVASLATIVADKMWKKLPPITRRCTKSRHWMSEDQKQVVSEKYERKQK